MSSRWRTTTCGKDQFFLAASRYNPVKYSAEVRRELR